MRTSLRAVGLLLTLLILSPLHAFAGVSPSVSTYSNGRFGFHAAYPSAWGEISRSANGDGARVTEPNGTATLSMYGWRLDEETIAQLFKTDSSDDPARTRKVTYKSLQPDWYVVSGFEGENIFYSKVIVRENEDRRAVFTLTFPKARKTEFDTLIDAMSRGLGFDELSWSDAHAFVARQYFSRNGEAIARQIQQVTHPSGSSPRFGGVEVSAEGRSLKVRLSAIWLGGILRGEHTTTVLWEVNEQQHVRAVVEKDTGNFAVAAPNRKQLDQMFEALYPKVAGAAEK